MTEKLYNRPPPIPLLPWKVGWLSIVMIHVILISSFLFKVIIHASAPADVFVLLKFVSLQVMIIAVEYISTKFLLSSTLL
jgi:uncharacterized membrane protein